MSNDDVSDFLFGGGSLAAKFEELGTKISGTVTDCRMAQQTSLDDGSPLTWSDGRPRMQLVVTLATEELDSSIDGDDGTRRLYAKGGNYEIASGSGKSMKDAIADAVKAAGAKTLESGGTLTVAYTGEGKRTNRGFNAPKLYKARYERPHAVVSEEDLFGAKGTEPDPF
jgi:hypothetical protein